MINLLGISEALPETLIHHKNADVFSFVRTAADQDNAYDINEKLRWSYAKGHDLVTWTEELLKAKQRFDHADEEFYKPSPLPSRQQITGMWQVLFEEGTIFHGEITCC